MTRRGALLLFLLIFVGAHAPWRLAALGVRVMLATPGVNRPAVGNDKYWDAIRLEVRLVSLGWQVGYVPGLTYGDQKAYGITSFHEHAIMVDSTLDWNGRRNVLFHEGGHVLAPFWVDRGQGEAFAESVAAIAAHDGLAEHARYLANYKLEFLVVSVLNWRHIYRAAAMLEE